MRSALANGEFELRYQPFIHVASGETCGFEALLRWHHPQRGMISPAQFIPLAEETGLIVPLGEWVLRTACAEAAKWPADLKIAINLSPVQFRSPELVPVIVHALASAGIPPERLELEVTETAIIQDSEAVFAALSQLHDLGVRIALDDFGTGYSSLSFLQKFPFDKVKIDRSFVSELSGATDESRRIARAIVRFAVSSARRPRPRASRPGSSSTSCAPMPAWKCRASTSARRSRARRWRRWSAGGPRRQPNVLRFVSQWRVALPDRTPPERISDTHEA